MSRRDKRRSKASYRRRVTFVPGQPQGQRMRGPRAHHPPRDIPPEMYNVFQVERPSAVRGVSHAHAGAGPSNHGSLTHTAAGAPHQQHQRIMWSTGPPSLPGGPSLAVQPLPPSGRVEVPLPQVPMPPTRDEMSHPQIYQASNANMGHSSQHPATYLPEGPIGPRSEPTVLSSGPSGPVGRLQVSSSTQQSPFAASSTDVQQNSQNSLEEDVARLIRDYPENGDQHYGYGTPGGSGMF